MIMIPLSKRLHLRKAFLICNKCIAISHEIMHRICFCIRPAPFFNKGQLYCVSSASLSLFLIVTWKFFLSSHLTSEFQNASVLNTELSVLPAVPSYGALSQISVQAVYYNFTDIIAYFRSPSVKKVISSLMFVGLYIKVIHFSYLEKIQQ